MRAGCEGNRGSASPRAGTVGAARIGRNARVSTHIWIGRTSPFLFDVTNVAAKRKGLVNAHRTRHDADRSGAANEENARTGVDDSGVRVSIGRKWKMRKNKKMDRGLTSVESQVEKIFRHTRSGSYGTRARYRDSCRAFARFVHEKFRLQNLRNLSEKHIVEYIRHRQEMGISPKTVKNDLAAIRYLHDQIPNPRYQIRDNQTLREKYGLVLDPTPSRNGNRAWTDEEYAAMKAHAERAGRQDVVDVMTLCRTMGLRITEAVAVSRAQAENALRTGTYEVRGEAKNGKWRKVPLSQEAREVFVRRLCDTPRGGRLFVPKSRKTHEVVNDMEKWLERHRERVKTEEGIRIRIHARGEHELTFHGLRYAYVQERVEHEMARGKTFEEAAAIVTKEVGHERIDVVKIYMGDT